MRHVEENRDTREVRDIVTTGRAKKITARVEVAHDHARGGPSLKYELRCQQVSKNEEGREKGLTMAALSSGVSTSLQYGPQTDKPTDPCHTPLGVDTAHMTHPTARVLQNPGHVSDRRVIGVPR